MLTRPTVALLAILCLASFAHAQDAPTTAPAPADEALYADADAQSSATITQVLPNSTTSQMILTNVKAIRVRQGILVINWGGSATTLLPTQFVTGLTVNKRAGGAPGAEPSTTHAQP